MVLELFTFEMLTGDNLTPLPASEAKWSVATNADEQITCTIPARPQITSKLDVWGATRLARNGLLAVVDGLPVAAGPLWKRTYTQGKTITLTAGGLRSYFDRRLLVPVGARGNPLFDANGDPITAYDTNLADISYGTMAKRYIQLARLWPGGAIPMMLPADEARPGYVRNIKAVDLKRIGALIDAFPDLEQGVDISFRPRYRTDGRGIYWEMTTGTVAQPRLGKTDPTLIRWTVGAKQGGAFDFEVSEDGTALAEEVFASGGRAGDKVLIAQARNTALNVQGFPLLQTVDSTHSDVSEPDKMQSYANQGAMIGQYSANFWKMKVRAAEPGTLKLGDYWVGDMATIDVDKNEPVIPAGPYTRRLASISGDQDNQHYSLAFAEALA